MRVVPCVFDTNVLPAISGGADYIISGDSDLLALNPFRGVQILPPHTFLKLLG
jgi:predicted nucleic acid-binding protein